LFPVLGLFDSQFLMTWQVSDHLQYLPLAAVMALVAGLVAVNLNRKVFWVVAVSLIASLLVLGFQRARVFATEESLFRETLQKNPAAAKVHNDLAVILVKQGDYNGAMEHFFAAVRLEPGDAGAELNLAKALDMHDRFGESEPCYLASIRIRPDNAEARRAFGQSLLQQGRYREAIVQFQVALCLKPDVQTRLELASLLHRLGDVRGATAQFRKAMSLDPEAPEASNNLAWLLATCSDETLRNGDEAVLLAQRACRQTGYKKSAIISTLAAAYAEAGRYPEAVSTAEKAIEMQHSNGETRYAAINEQLLRLYRQNQPYHEAPRPGL
jgi:Flp pilus assembly protein TadD